MSSQPARLSVCSLVSAPAARLDAWLRHVRTFADEIVLGVDAASGPETLATARAYADDVSLVELAGLPNPAYDWIAQRATGDWVLALDDDEVLAAEFIRGLPELLAGHFTHFHLPIRWLVYDEGGQLAWIREFPWYPNHATRLFRNLPGCVHHPPELHSAWEVAGEGCALPAERGAILHLNLALHAREVREQKMERHYRRPARPELPSCEEYYLYEDYPDLTLVPLRDEPAAPAVLFGLPGPEEGPRDSSGARAVPVATDHDLRVHAADQSEHPPIWSAEYSAHDTPGELGTNRGHLVNVTVRNTSEGTWRSDGRVAGRVVLSYRWRRPDGEIVIPQGDITLLPQALGPGEEARVVAGLWTPSEPGDYVLEWQMLCERVAWFSNHGVSPLEHEARVVDRGQRPEAPHFPQPLAASGHVRQRTSSGTAGVALTFDDGPDPEWTPRILERLKELDVPATFFVIGARAAAHPRLLRKMRRGGHEIGLHGNLHLRHDEHAPEVIRADAYEALAAMGGRRRTRLWRPPHGIATPATERVAHERGLELINWTADTQDWRDAQTTDEMLARVEPLLQPGAVVLLHDGVGPGSPRENPASTLALLEPLVEAVRAKGLQLTAIANDQLLVPLVVSNACDPRL